MAAQHVKVTAVAAEMALQSLVQHTFFQTPPPRQQETCVPGGILLMHSYLWNGNARRCIAILEDVRIPAVIFSLAIATLPLTGCRHQPTPPAEAQKQAAAALNDARRDLSQIPPPSKNLYMNAGTMAEWQNPSLTVQEKMITLHVLMPDANPSDLGKGTMLRPEAARKQVLNIDPSNLAEALNAVPKEAWPYGRVVAIEEAHDAPEAARRQLRVNMEKAIDTLNSVGVVADEWSNDRPIGLR